MECHSKKRDAISREDVKRVLLAIGSLLALVVSVPAAAQTPNLIGQWRCDFNALGSPGVVIESYSPTNYQDVLTYEGQQIIAGGSYTASPVGPNVLRVSYQLANLYPQRICNGPSDVGGNCTSTRPAFDSHVSDLVFVNPNIFQARPTGVLCRRQGAVQ
jgi:hypothetical protein